MPDKNVFEDSGTFTADQANRDWADAAHLNASAHTGNGAGAIVLGLGLTPDYGVPVVDVASGMVKITATNVDSIDHGSGVTTWPEVTITSNVEATTVSLTDSDTNEIYVSVDLSGGPDSTSVTAVDSGETAPTDPHIKIGEVDTSGNTVSEQWGLLTDSGGLSFPTVSDANSYATEIADGTVIWDRTNSDFYVVSGSGTIKVDPGTHATTHQSGGSDTLDAQALSNFSHNTTHQSGGSDTLDAQALNNFAHQSTHQDGGADEIQVETLATSGSDGQVVTATAGGGLAMETPASGAIGWVQDGNSPETQTGVSSATFNLASTYDIVRSYVSILDNSGASSNPGVQVNGETGGVYDYVTLGGSVTLGANEWAQVFSLNNNWRSKGWLEFGQEEDGLSMRGTTGKGEGATFEYGHIQNGPYPLSSITLTSLGNVDVTVTNYGLNISNP